MSILLPHNLAPTPSQWAFRRAVLFEGKTRIPRVIHRRYGKDLDSLELKVEASQLRRGTYVHCLPELQQAKKIIWTGMDDGGTPFLDRIPPKLIGRNKAGMLDINDTELRVRFKNGSILQLVGADKFDTSLVGTNVVWATMSEYAVSPRYQRAWDLLRPILESNGGVADFPFTPRGKNHGWKLWQVCQEQMRKNRSTWWGQFLTIEDTAAERRGWGSKGPFTRQDIHRLIEEGMDPFLAEQEYYCSFEGAMQGSIYGELLQEIEKAGQIKELKYDPYLPVHTHCDIGFGDLFIIGFFQETPDETRLIDCYADRGKPLDHYARVIHSRGYSYGSHFAPWDAGHHNIAHGETASKDIMWKLGIHWDVVPKHGVYDGIQTVRRHFRRLFIDPVKCGDFIQAAREYRWKWDAQNEQFSKEPVHDVHSHYMDMLRNWAMSGNVGKAGSLGFMAETKVEADFDLKEIFR